ncbi:MAG: hypothetical protein RL745_78 [Actinomycetota bacterium]
MSSAHLSNPRQASAWAWTRRWAWASLIAQMLIVVTGAFVRVTASGLGCPTWPECMPGSYTPVTVPETVYHAWVEFGNRLLTFAVAVTAIGALTSYIVARRRQALPQGFAISPIAALLAASALIGTAAQAVVGGISVLTGLSPTWVAAHFLLSAVILIAQTRYVAIFQLIPQEGINEQQGWIARRTWLPVVMCVSAGITVVLGTVVTGSGPHAGDINVTHRFPLDPRIATMIHSIAAAVLVGTTSFAFLKRAQIPVMLRRSATALIILQCCQGLLGFAQYQAGLPPLMVVAHVALAVSIWVGCLRFAWLWRAVSVSD